jgi:hypothetical protein
VVDLVKGTSTTLEDATERYSSVLARAGQSLTFVQRAEVKKRPRDTDDTPQKGGGGGGGKGALEKLYHSTVYSALNIPAGETEPVPGHPGYLRYKDKVWNSKNDHWRRKSCEMRTEKADGLNYPAKTYRR